ncbi:BTAD domain-containing putative transcriptional regulator [Maritimibacter sp. DP1N21-5]|uniref:AfsR/SARP family transcriptional regulator n=1 Tax=Maritimibacter sp. DP1N21-5 TaxID=2836867 RepID=UPI001C43B245|nr:BTAD domain-containing putative transcriptional regulator [Maritimibacter sp. DP1N21-5]MBV7410675.1 response regulator [Maritimibacter sp. DP1N21-5]
MILSEGSHVNACMFCDFSQTGFIDSALAPYDQRFGPVVVSDDAWFRPDVLPHRRISPTEVGLDTIPLDSDATIDRLRAAIAALEGPTAVIVDMGWGLDALHGADSYETWGSITEVLSLELGMPFMSLYNKELMIEDQMQAAFRAHRQFLAPSGLYENPFWMPPDLVRDGTLDEQLGFMLGRVVPDFAGGRLFEHTEREAARGATPDWLEKDREQATLSVGGARWQIHCLGRLRVLVGQNREVDWQVPGSAPKKTRTLFAYLLQSGEKGAHADRIGELLWPRGGSEQQKRARLHHTVAMLRRALGDQDAVLRQGDYYRLNAPVGSWLDITSFEQLCRRGFSLARHGEREAALRIYFAAERLYGGDLFEDLPQDYVENDHDDWCMPRRIWLRDMAVRHQYDFSNVLRQSGRLGEALEHVLKALAIDPTSEAAHCEALRVYFAQGRIEAMHRHYRQLAKREGDVEIDVQGTEIEEVYLDLCDALENMTPDQRKTKVMALR